MSEPDPIQANNGRLMLGVAGLLFIPLSIMGTYFLMFEAPRPRTAVEWLFRIVLEELAITATVFFTMGFVWAITGSRRVKRLLDIATVKFAWVFLPLVAGTIAVVMVTALAGLL